MKLASPEVGEAKGSAGSQGAWILAPAELAVTSWRDLGRVIYPFSLVKGWARHTHSCSERSRLRCSQTDRCCGLTACVCVPSTVCHSWVT